MEYTTFGRTGATVSRIGFGGAPAGLKNYLQPFDPDSPDDRIGILQAIDAALEAGITYFDTAPGYGAGRSEELLGYGLEGSRDRVFIASKAGICAPDELRRTVENSLRRLRTDRLDLLQIHGTSYTDEAARAILDGGMLAEMERLKAEGLVRFIGFTSEDTNAAVYEFIRSGRFDAMQICYNLFMQHPYDPNRPFGSMLEAERAGLGIAVMRTTTSGLFQRWMRQADPGNVFDYTGALIQFVLSNPLVDVALIGMRTADEVRRNAALCDDTVGRMDLNELFTYYR